MGCSWPTIAASQQCHLRLQAVLSRCGPRPQPSLRNLNLQPLLLGFLHQSHYTLKAALQLFFFRWLEGVMGVLLAGGCVFASCLLCAWVLRPKAKRLLLLVVVLPLAVLSVGASVAAVVLAIVAGTSVGTHCTVRRGVCTHSLRTGRTDLPLILTTTGLGCYRPQHDSRGTWNPFLSMTGHSGSVC
ncbi:MAG: hypothetical protein KVP17_002739 [Porospora cf. gigantea B]|uniref:uncharacterized protein n=1 Tax=Porospora cf. gigantea B TaxID=2853592 RepID=UPI0035717E5F|nr:MAG: hypothetical protein KVP17_002739 [Porospora cf. gigantea B]